MTIEEADKRVREAKEALTAHMRRLWTLDPINTGWAEMFLRCGRELLKNLEAAEKARAALDKPRLMTPRERAKQYYPVDVSKTLICALEADRADILAQAEKLPRIHVGETIQPADRWNAPCILLSDLRNMITGDKA